jgi:hypothetical protein
MYLRLLSTTDTDNSSDTVEGTDVTVVDEVFDNNRRRLPIAEETLVVDTATNTVESTDVTVVDEVFDNNSRLPIAEETLVVDRATKTITSVSSTDSGVPTTPDIETLPPIVVWTIETSSSNNDDTYVSRALVKELYV